MTSITRRALSMKNMTGSRRLIWLVCSLLALFHIGYIASIHLANPPGTINIRGLPAGIDTVVYLESGSNHTNRQPLYNLNPWPDELPYLYHPLFAMFFSWLTPLGAHIVGLLVFAVEVISYLLALVIWPKALDKLGAHDLAAAMRTWQPALLIFTTFFSYIYFLNVVHFLFLAVGIVTWLLASHRDWAAAVVLMIILLIKPQWVFPASIPLFAGQWQRTAKLALRIGIVYLAANIIYLLAVGPTYGLQQLGDYLQTLRSADQLYPWAGQWEPIKTFSLQQMFFFLFGLERWVWFLVGLLKLLALVIFVLHIRLLWQQKPSPQAVLWGVFSLYLTTVLVIGIAHELTFGVCIFACLRASPDRAVRRWTLLYLPYGYLEVLDLAFGAFNISISSFIPIVGLPALLLWWGCLRSLVMEMAHKPSPIPVPAAESLSHEIRREAA